MPNTNEQVRLVKLSSCVKLLREVLPKDMLSKAYCGRENIINLRNLHSVHQCCVHSIVLCRSIEGLLDYL